MLVQIRRDHVIQSTIRLRERVSSRKSLAAQITESGYPGTARGREWRSASCIQPSCFTWINFFIGVIVKQTRSNDMERYICVHGHFYQPPRENPWLEAVELQDSAHPYHDWNERITAECYAPNATSRILDGEGRIVQLVNNYTKISFNFGPTILAWLVRYAPNIYQSIVEADRESQGTFGGHGSALAQAYNHVILPLANRRDRRTQILWGMRDFEHRFERKPEGMWLPEAAVDLDSLDFLSEQGILFTILAPRQAKRMRPIGKKEWQDVSGGRIDPTMPYVQNLPSGRKIALFFYDGPISRAVAFEGVLVSGESFAGRLLGGFSEKRNRPQILNIATDGESYGHHHPHGDMALAYALHYIESNGLAQLTNYGAYLEKHPPTHEVEIFENSSWSCVHGVERWRKACGCNSGKHPGWNQKWRAPLREALDWLRDTLAATYAEKARSFFKEPWRARDEYIQLVLDRSVENTAQFFHRHGLRALNAQESITALKLLELQRQAMLMYTSCGWFFDEISGIETVQILQYAGRALQLAEEAHGDLLKPRFAELLEKAKSNIPEHKDGSRIFEKFVTPAAVDLEKVGAHYAMSSLFEDYGEHAGINCFSVDKEAYQKSEAGKVKLALGRVKVTSEITTESVRLCFGVLHWGDHNLSGCVRECAEDEPHEAAIREIFETFGMADFPGTLHLLEKHFGASTYSLSTLFRDEQRKILGLILQTTLADVESVYRQVYENNAPLLRFLKAIYVPLPAALHTAAEYVLNASLRKAFEDKELNLDSIVSLLEVANIEGVSLDAATLEMAIRRRIEGMAEGFRQKPEDYSLLQALDRVTSLLQDFPFEVNLRKLQNLFYAMLQTAYPEFQRKAEKEETAKEWVRLFTSLGEKLYVRV
jgi:alpha-amylase/alpha-mannosidase (GH57 family)